MKLDVETALTALAANYDVFHVDELLHVLTLIETLVYDGAEYSVEIKYHKG